MWHVRKPVSDEPLLFSEIQLVKHKPEKQSKKDLCSSVRTHDPIPHFARSVTTQNITTLVALYDASGLKLPVLETIRDNDFMPVSQKQFTDVVLQDELFVTMKEHSDFEINYSIGEMSESGAKQYYEGCVNVDFNTAMFIEKNTRLQSRTSFWFEQREYRLTSSMFGAFCRMQDISNSVKTFTQKKKFFTTRSVRHGINYESQAFARYLQERQCTNCPIGLIVNPNVPFLAASPDRLVKVDNQLRLVEIKCPYSVSQERTRIHQEIKDKRFYLYENTQGMLELKKTHDFYFQVQGQLNLCGIDKCDFVNFVPPNDIVVIEIARDICFRTLHLNCKVSMCNSNSNQVMYSRTHQCQYEMCFLFVL